VIALALHHALFKQDVVIIAASLIVEKLRALFQEGSKPMKNKMKLVPVEPTEGMIDAGLLTPYIGYDEPDFKSIYKAMIAECETVEVVDEGAVFEFLTDTVKEKYGVDVLLQFTPCMARMNGLLHENGYQIIRKFEK